MKDIRKYMKKAVKARKATGEYSPVTISLSKWCEAYGNPERFEWIRGMIFNKADEIGEEAQNHLYLCTDLYDICFDWQGIAVFFEVLSDFFTDKETYSLMKWLKKKDEIEKIVFDIEKAMPETDDKLLTESITAWQEQQEKHKGTDMEKFCLQILTILKTEQERRNKKTIFKSWRKKNEY